MPHRNRRGRLAADAAASGRKRLHVVLGHQEHPGGDQATVILADGGSLVRPHFVQPDDDSSSF